MRYAFCTSFWLAPGSGVSINLGRTVAVHTWSDAANLLFALTGSETHVKPGQRCATAAPGGPFGRRAALPDSVQILQPRTEYFSREPRHEILWLGHSECEALRHDTPGVRCGRSPHLFPCTPNSSALRFMARCRPAAQPAFSPRVRHALGGEREGALDRFRPSSPCSASACHRAEDGAYYCPREEAPPTRAAHPRHQRVKAWLPGA